MDRAFSEDRYMIFWLICSHHQEHFVGSVLVLHGFLFGEREELCQNVDVGPRGKFVDMYCGCWLPVEEVLHSLV